MASYRSVLHSYSKDSNDDRDDADNTTDETQTISENEEAKKLAKSNDSAKKLDVKNEGERPKNVSKSAWERFQALQKKADTLSKRSTEKRIKHLQKSILEKVKDSLTTDEEKDILREHDVKFGPPVKEKNRGIPNKTDKFLASNSEQSSEKCEWRDVQKYLGVNDHLTNGTTRNPRHMSGLEKQMDKAIQDGQVHVAAELSDQLASRDFAVKINEAFTARKFVKRKKEEEDQERSNQKKKLNWGFEHKQRWETKSNM